MAILLTTLNGPVALRASAPNNSEAALNAIKKIIVMVLKSRRIRFPP
jgi:hypothetical protein